MAGRVGWKMGRRWLGAAAAALLLGGAGPARAETEVLCAAFAPDGRTLVSGWSDGKVRVVDLRTGKTRATLPASAGSADVLAFSRDGGKFATTAMHGAATIRVWETASGRLLQTLPGGEESIHQLAFSPDGTRLAAAMSETVHPAGTRFSHDVAEVRLWNIATGAREATLPQAAEPLFFTPDGRTLISGQLPSTRERQENHGPTVLWDTATGRARRVLPTQVILDGEMALAPDGSFLVTGGPGQAVQVWNPQTGDLLRTLPGADSSPLVLSPDGSVLVTGANGDREAERDRPLLLWDPRSGRRLAQLEGAGADVRFSRDGRVLLTSGDGPTLIVWDGHTGKRRQTLRYRRDGDMDEGEEIALSPDGRLAACSGPLSPLRLWDTETGKLVATRVFPASVMRFSPDGTVLAVNHIDSLVLLDVRHPAKPVELGLAAGPPAGGGGRAGRNPRPARGPVVRDRPTPRAPRPTPSGGSDRFIFY